MNILEKLFRPAERGSTVKRELLAGLTSFMAMCYLIFVVPSMLADAGMPKDPWPPPSGSRSLQP